jgi:hypothetical protein
VSREQGIEGERACQSAELGLVDGPVQLVGADDLREVDERARGCRDRDSVVLVALVRRQGDAMGRDAGPLAVAWRDDVDLALAGVTDAPQRRRGAMAQHRVRARREHRGHPAAMPREDRVADGIDAAMEHVQRAARDAPVDRAMSEPQLEQLCAAHHAVLTAGQISDQRLSGSSPKLGIKYGVDFALDRHATMVPKPA